MSASRRSLVVSALALATLAQPASADGCAGDPGLSLATIPPLVIPTGNTLVVQMQAPAGEFAFLLASGGQGPTPTPIGLLCLDPTFDIIAIRHVPASGVASAEFPIPCLASRIGHLVFLQFVSLDAFTFDTGISNGTSITVTDGNCGSACTTSISKGFNGTPIPAGSYLWFNSVVKATGLDGSPQILRFYDSTISFEVDGTTHVYPVPETTIEFAPTGSAAFAAPAWKVGVPVGYSGNAFLAGLVVPLPSGLPGGVGPVTWSGKFESTSTGATFQWKWAAAAYSTFSEDLDAVGAKPIDGSQSNPYHNSDHAGTPELYKDFVIGGATGGGGSNFTGSYSATKSCP